MHNLVRAQQQLQAQINKAASLAARPTEEVQVVAVTKGCPVQTLLNAWQIGLCAFAENYASALYKKATALADLPIEWHFIGPLQRNKTRLVAEHAHWVHTIDRFLIAERLSTQRPAELPDLQVCLQVRMEEDRRPHGVPPEQTLALAQSISQLPRLRLRGLMCVPAQPGSGGSACRTYRSMRTLLTELQAHQLTVDTLSMGMSSDFEQAIAEGSTMIRIGTALFGERSRQRQSIVVE